MRQKRPKQRYDVRLLRADPSKERIDGLRDARSYRFLGRLCLLVAVIAICVGIFAKIAIVALVGVAGLIVALFYFIRAKYNEVRFKDN